MYTFFQKSFYTGKFTTKKIKLTKSGYFKDRET